MLYTKKEQGRSCCIYFRAVVPPESEMISTRLFSLSTQRWLIRQPEPEMSPALPPLESQIIPGKRGSAPSPPSAPSSRLNCVSSLLAGRLEVGEPGRNTLCFLQRHPPGSCPLVSGLLFWRVRAGRLLFTLMPPANIAPGLFCAEQRWKAAGIGCLRWF